MFAPDGRLLLLHLLTGAHELPQAGSPLTGGEFFAEPQRGDSPSADGGSVAAPAAGTAPYPRRRAKRKGHLRFPFLFELLPFPCFLIWRRLPTCDRFEKRNGRGFFLPCFSQPVRTTRYITATQTGKSTQARHARVAQLVSLEITDSTCEDKLYLIDRFAGAGRYNAQKKLVGTVMPTSAWT